MDPLAFIAQGIAAKQAAPELVTETSRVVGLPVASYTGAGVQEHLQRGECGITLNDLQRRALEAIAREGGALLPLAVGSGKTFIALLAGAVLGAQYVVVLCPASVVAQMEREYGRLSRHFKTVPTRIVSYAQLSRPEGTSLLNAMAQAANTGATVALVADEAHKLKRPDSARTMRVNRLFEAAPSVHFIALSGTMTAKSLKDFSHLGAWALRDRAPVPRDTTHLESWAACIDAAGRPGPDDWQRISPLVKADGLAGDARKAAARQAFQHRFHSAPGVVASRENELGVSLRIHSLTVDLPEVIEEKLALADGGEDPNGDILTEDMMVWRLKRQLSCGFYYQWVWPDDQVDWDWLYARKDWNGCVRRELQASAREGYDSPALVQEVIERELATGARQRSTHKAWLAWAAQKHKPAPPTHTFWLSDFLVKDVLRRRTSEATIYWYESAAMADALERAGIPVVRAGEPAPRKRPSGGHVALSILGHGTGTDGLQHWCSRNVVLEPPQQGSTWEQLLGRTHRVGQSADEVDVYVYTHTEAFDSALRQARLEATYIQDTTGNVQKLRIADFTGH